MISILYDNYSYDETLITNKTFSDLRLSNLLDQNAQQIISKKCTSHDIALRQEIFDCINDSNECKWFSECYNKLIVFDKYHSMLCDKTMTNLERAFIFLVYVEAYEDFLKHLSHGNSAYFFSRLSNNAYKSIEKLNKFSPEIEKYRLIAERYRNIVVNNIGQIELPQYCEDNSFVSEIVHCSLVMECEATVPRFRPVRIDPSMSASVECFCGDDFIALVDIQKTVLPHIDVEYLCLKSEMAFYISINNLRKQLEYIGIPSCIPTISVDPQYKACELYDITMSNELGNQIVPNDISLETNSSTCFIKGVNGGGKTSFLRAVAINLIFFISGCPVYCRSAQIYPFSDIHVLFQDAETFLEGGRLLSEQQRVDVAVRGRSSKTFVFINEMFSSTDDVTGTLKSIETMNKLSSVGGFCLFVTHFETLESTHHSMYAILGADGKPTYRITREDSMAVSSTYNVLKKYNLDREYIMRLIQ